MNDTKVAATATAEPMSDLARQFAGRNGDYYARQFERLGEARSFAWTFNWPAALLGPLWLAGRSLWGLFWVFLLAEMVAFVQLGRGLWGDLGADDAARAVKLGQSAAERLAQAEQAAAEGAANAEGLAKAAEYMQANAEQAQAAAEAAAALAPLLLAVGIFLVVLIKGAQGRAGELGAGETLHAVALGTIAVFGSQPVGIAGGRRPDARHVSPHPVPIHDQQCSELAHRLSGRDGVAGRGGGRHGCHVRVVDPARGRVLQLDYRRYPHAPRLDGGRPRGDSVAGGDARDRRARVAPRRRPRGDLHRRRARVPGAVGVLGEEHGHRGVAGHRRAHMHRGRNPHRGCGAPRTGPSTPSCVRCWISCRRCRPSST